MAPAKDKKKKIDLDFDSDKELELPDQVDQEEPEYKAEEEEPSLDEIAKEEQGIPNDEDLMSLEGATDEVELEGTDPPVVDQTTIDTNTEVEDEIPDVVNDTTQTIIVKCPFCLEEVVSMDFCPVCGNPLNHQVAQTNLRGMETEETLLEETFSEDDMYTNTENPSLTSDIDLNDPFSELPYQKDRD